MVLMLVMISNDEHAKADGQKQCHLSHVRQQDHQHPAQHHQQHPRRHQHDDELRLMIGDAVHHDEED